MHASLSLPEYLCNNFHVKNLLAYGLSSSSVLFTLASVRIGTTHTENEHHSELQQLGHCPHKG